MVIQHKQGIGRITLIALVVMGFFLGACGDANQIQAQVAFDRGVRTYNIVANSFRLQSDSGPAIIVTGEATQYTLVDEGRVLFTANDSSGARTILLDPDDIIIERPIANSVTVITQTNRLL